MTSVHNHDVNSTAILTWHVSLPPPCIAPAQRLLSCTL